MPQDSPRAAHRPHTPNRSRASQRDEQHTDRVSGHITLAPALEHGKQSNKEERNCKHAENFHQHNFPRAQERAQLRFCAKGRESRLGVSNARELRCRRCQRQKIQLIGTG